VSNNVGVYKHDIMMMIATCWNHVTYVSITHTLYDVIC